MQKLLQKIVCSFKKERVENPHFGGETNFTSASCLIFSGPRCLGIYIVVRFTVLAVNVFLLRAYATQPDHQHYLRAPRRPENSQEKLLWTCCFET